MRILLAEDERSLARALVALLEKNNYSADAVHDGVDALEYLKSGNYDSLILDIMMPRMDGLEVLRQLRAEGNPIPVLLLRNPRQLVPTERFLERIWGYDSEVEPNVVWVYIAYLRKKLAALRADIQIKATRNAGYSLEELP
ncbi:DNA-binding response regulator [Gemmiger sp. An194]|uniref:response regulator transcription factor n=1 Tax=Gemmiger sp. An194 TaxID=1965582 RepID=UPI000B37BF51|nr:DNA-binding response regulator [Gemmiger sp. An194]OUP24109.1 hypothetical protein B5F28_08605 [Gemmiger sp. An194]